VAQGERSRQTRDASFDVNDLTIVVANEFADVRVRRVSTRNGARLEIYSPRRGTRIHLDAVELDLLSFQEPEIFSEMLERTPRPGG
jgi:hypothetical protein